MSWHIGRVTTAPFYEHRTIIFVCDLRFKRCCRQIQSLFYAFECGNTKICPHSPSPESLQRIGITQGIIHSVLNRHVSRCPTPVVLFKWECVSFIHFRRSSAYWLEFCQYFVVANAHSRLERYQNILFWIKSAVLSRRKIFSSSKLEQRHRSVARSEYTQAHAPTLSIAQHFQFFLVGFSFVCSSHLTLIPCIALCHTHAHTQSSK